MANLTSDDQMMLYKRAADLTIQGMEISKLADEMKLTGFSAFAQQYRTIAHQMWSSATQMREWADKV